MRSSVNYREREEDEDENENEICRHSLKETSLCHYKSMDTRAVAYTCAGRCSSGSSDADGFARDHVPNTIQSRQQVSRKAANKCVVFIVDTIVDIAGIDIICIYVVRRIRRPTRRYNFQAAYNDDWFVRFVKINAAAVDVIVVGSCYSLQLVSSSKCMTYFILLLMD
uniref:Uncharacterized protein n=1 Tax=Glossina palpalis gambiensis TaxID=67801 RepID=A0A1B0B2W7_9MUSC